MRLTQKRVKKLMSARRRLGNLVDEEDSGELQLDRSRDPALFPVVNALDGPGACVAQGLSELSRPTESFDQLAVSNGGDRFLVHASLNTTFKQKSNAVFNNKVFRCAMIPGMHPTTKRLYEAVAHVTKGRLTEQTEVANYINVSPQRLNNWERRGMSKQGIFEAADHLGINPIWLLNATEEMLAAHGKAQSASPEQSSNRDENRPVLIDSNHPSSAQNSISPATPIRYSLDVTKIRRVFVVGRAQGGLPERIWTDGDYPVGATDRYAELATSDPNAFLTPIIGDSMSPRYNAGEFALIEPSTEPELEDDVLVRLTTGETMLKRLLARRGGIRLGSYNEPEIRTFQPEEISWMYYSAHPVPARKIKNRT